MRIRPFILSFLAHVAMIGPAVIVGLLATTGLPDPPRSMSFKVLRSVALLDSAAVEAVRQWRFTPTLLNGVPVQIILVVTIAFTLR